MRTLSLLLAAAMVASAGCAHVDTAATGPAVEAALASPARSAADRERDARDRPQAVLAFAGFAPGMTVADVFGGGGYYSEILSGVVGPQGRIVLINNPPYDDYAKKDLTPRLAGNRLPNVAYAITPPAAMQLGSGTLDGALIVMSYHDLYVSDPEQGWPAIDAGQFIDQIVTALKPGGRLLIVDHDARRGSGKTDTQALHRIEEAFAIADFEAHGLTFAGRLDTLRSAADDHSQNVFDPAIKGKTDRFVHLYRKP